MIQPWKILSSLRAADFRIFTVRTDRKVSPRTGVEHDFQIIESSDWVNVIAVTPDHQLILVEQYRHGSNSVELEIPGGVIDPKDPSPVAAGVRELREETGYEGGEPCIIGTIRPNPAIMSNLCHTVYVPDCRLLHPVEWDRGEDIITRLVPLSEIPGLVSSGRIRHSLVVVALYYFDLWQRARQAQAQQ